MRAPRNRFRQTLGAADVRVPLVLAVAMACLLGIVSGIAPAKNGTGNGNGNGSGGAPPGLTKVKPQKSTPAPAASKPAKAPKPAKPPKPPKPNGSSAPNPPGNGNGNGNGAPSTPAAPAPPTNNTFGASTTTSAPRGDAGGKKRRGGGGGQDAGRAQDGGAGEAQGGGAGAAQTAVVEQAEDEGTGNVAENATAADSRDSTGRLGELPFTGLQTIVLLLIGLDLIYVGFALRRRLAEIPVD